jgi:hypothetical protein
MRDPEPARLPFKRSAKALPRRAQGMEPRARPAPVSHDTEQLGATQAALDVNAGPQLVLQGSAQ